MTFPFYHVDAFTECAFSGNQAGVCLINENLPDKLMQQIANENNLAETAFVRKANDTFLLKWFTPTLELPLCGHGTIAAAHVLWKERLEENNEITKV